MIPIEEYSKWMTIETTDGHAPLQPLADKRKNGDDKSRFSHS